MAANPLASNAILQRRILVALREGPALNATWLAIQLTAPRPSVSRALHTLAGCGFVEQQGRVWVITAAGLAALPRIQARTDQATQRTLARLAVYEAKARAARLAKGQTATPPHICVCLHCGRTLDPVTPAEIVESLARGIEQNADVVRAVCDQAITEAQEVFPWH